MTLKEALTETPSGYVKNKKLNIEMQDWATLVGHIAHGNLKLHKLLKSERWQYDLSPECNNFESNSIKNILAKKYLMPRI